MLDSLTEIINLSLQISAEDEFTELFGTGSEKICETEESNANDGFADLFKIGVSVDTNDSADEIDGIEEVKGNDNEFADLFGIGVTAESNAFTDTFEISGTEELNDNVDEFEELLEGWENIIEHVVLSLEM